MAQLQTDIPRDINFLPPGGGGSLRIAYAKHLLREYLTEEHAKRHGWSKEEDHGLKPIFRHVPSSLDDVEESDGLLLDPDSDSAFKGKICIVGAGVTGLFTALMLKISGIYNFDVIEASDRVGGRLYTHWFSDKKKPDSDHDYYDIGAMRIPKIQTMQSALDLIEFLQLGDKLVEYNYKEKSKGKVPVPHMWWYKNKKPEYVPSLHLLSGHSPSGELMLRTQSMSKFDTAIECVIKSFTQAESFDIAFKEYMGGTNDNYSTRAWLMFQANPK
ncbi:hypothetical protein N0V85_005168 [Neurospora sp. IMI 360204]|nr:hypothetical protein N0V85_005168 [Neurospora sp. IMI 360204]